MEDSPLVSLSSYILPGIVFVLWGCSCCLGVINTTLSLAVHAIGFVPLICKILLEVFEEPVSVYTHWGYACVSVWLTFSSLAIGLVCALLHGLVVYMHSDTDRGYAPVISKISLTTTFWYPLLILKEFKLVYMYQRGYSSCFDVIEELRLTSTLPRMLRIYIAVLMGNNILCSCHYNLIKWLILDNYCVNFGTSTHVYRQRMQAPFISV